jgi:VanZ family protein
MNSALLAFGEQSKKIHLFIYLFAFSLLMELIQHFIPYRHFSFADLLANGLGLFIGQIIGLTIKKLLHKTGFLSGE